MRILASAFIATFPVLGIAQSCSVFPLPTDTTFGSVWVDGAVHPDGNLIILGLTDDNLWDATVRKVDLTGNVVWSKRIATVNNTVWLTPTKVVTNANGEIMVFGRRRNVTPMNYGVNHFAFVLDASGDLQWARIYQLSDNFGDYANARYSDDAQPISTGWMLTISKTDGVHAVQLDNAGQIVQRTAYVLETNGMYSCSAGGALVEANGEMVFTGTSWNRPFVMHTDSNGQVDWHFAYDFEQCVPVVVMKAANGDYLISGGRQPQSVYYLEFPSTDPFLMRLDASGQFLWAYAYDGGGYAKSIAELPNGEILLGCTQPWNALLRTDATGALLGSTQSTAPGSGVDIIGLQGDTLLMGRHVGWPAQVPELIVTDDVAGLTCAGLSNGLLLNSTNYPTSATTDTLFVGTDSTRTWTMALGLPIEMDNLDLIAYGSMGAARPGFNVNSYGYVSNAMMQGSGPITATMVLDPALIYQSAVPAPALVSGNTVSWNLPALSGIWAYHQLAVTSALPPDTALLGTDITCSLLVEQDSTEYSLTNNSAVFTRTVTGSYDPNDKLVFPKDFYHITGDSILDYTIRFQNTGTDTAFNIVVIDTLPPDVDVLTFQAGAASHPYTYSLTGEGLLKFTFNNILLPDSNTNEPLSHGLVNFRIKPIQPIYLGQTISNEADIYFDFNPPVRTPPATVVVTDFMAVKPAAPTNELKLYPVPVRDVLTVEVPKGFLPRNAIITGSDGRAVWSSGVMNAKERLMIPVQNLATGAYTLTLLSTHGDRSQARFVKE